MLLIFFFFFWWMVIYPLGLCNASELGDIHAASTLVNLSPDTLTNLLVSETHRFNSVINVLDSCGAACCRFKPRRVQGWTMHGWTTQDDAAYIGAMTLIGVRFRGLSVMIAIWLIAAYFSLFGSVLNSQFVVLLVTGPSPDVYRSGTYRTRQDTPGFESLRGSWD